MTENAYVWNDIFWYGMISKPFHNASSTRYYQSFNCIQKLDLDIVLIDFVYQMQVIKICDIERFTTEDKPSHLQTAYFVLPNNNNSLKTFSENFPNIMTSFLFWHGKKQIQMIFIPQENIWEGIKLLCLLRTLYI